MRACLQIPYRIRIEGGEGGSRHAHRDNVDIEAARLESFDLKTRGQGRSAIALEIGNGIIRADHLRVDFKHVTVRIMEITPRRDTMIQDFRDPHVILQTPFTHTAQSFHIATAIQFRSDMLELLPIGCARPSRSGCQPVSRCPPPPS